MKICFPHGSLCYFDSIQKKGLKMFLGKLFYLFICILNKLRKIVHQEKAFTGEILDTQYKPYQPDPLHHVGQTALRKGQSECRYFTTVLLIPACCPLVYYMQRTGQFMNKETT